MAGHEQSAAAPLPDQLGALAGDPAAARLWWVGRALQVLAQDPVAPPLPRRVVKPAGPEVDEDGVPPADTRWVAFLMAALTVLGLLLAAYFTRPFFFGGR